MLQLILGRAGSGKTYRIREQVKQLAEQNTEKVMLLVPEQYSFESEKAMLRAAWSKTSKQGTGNEFYSSYRYGVSRLWGQRNCKIG